MSQALETPFVKSRENVYCLREIAAPIMDFDDLLLSHYPAMKLGCTPEIQWYAEQLAQLAMTPIAERNDASWVVIAPPFYQLPSAANLLAEQVSEHTKESLGSDSRISLVQPRLAAQTVVFNTQAEFDLYYHYSKNDVSQRMAERQRVQQSLQTEQLTQQLQHQNVLVVNDINVTGTHQHFMQQAFDAAGAKQCIWLYILNLDAQLAAAHPEIEYQINNSRLATPSEFAQVLQRDDIRYTVRCLSRLFNENDANFRDILHSLHSLSGQHCQRLLQHATIEGRYNSELFADKMGLLTQLAHSPQSSTLSPSPSPSSPAVSPKTGEHHV